MATNELFRKVSALARAEVESLATGERHVGERGDGGAQELRQIVSVWEAGLAGTVPLELRKFAQQAQNVLDPEWAAYQRLRAKFEDGKT